MGEGAAKSVRGIGVLPRALIGAGILVAAACVVGSAVKQLDGGVDPLLASLNIGSGEDATGAGGLSREAAAALVDLSFDNLRRSPLSVDDIRNAGLAVEALGRPDQARSILTIAGDLSWRDSATQLWLFSDAIRRQRFADAILRADALMRRNRMVPQVMPLMFVMATSPDARAAIVERLAQDPHWRASFFRLARNNGDDAASLRAIVSDLAATDSPATDEELSYTINRLVETESYGAARDLWLAGHPEARSRFSSSGYVEGFDQVVTGTDQRDIRFGWTLADSPGLSLTPKGESSARDVALRIAPLGMESRPVGHALLILDPGTYTLSLDVAPVGTGAEDFDWKISCLPDKQEIPESVSASSSDGDWGRLSWQFTLPLEGCAAQQMSLVTKAGAATGSAPLMVDNLRVQRTAR